jgi:ParB/RepB/Spo0J family partition protein
MNTARTGETITVGPYDPTLPIIVEQIPVDQIQPSATNPRKHIDQATLEELAASIKSVGVQVPLSLREDRTITPRDRAEIDAGYAVLKRFEIVGGERRWRAAQIAGLETVPAIVRQMTDAECRESQLVDNLQRADLTPMEEAECYEALQSAELPVEVLATKVGKTVPYVTQRLRLLQLIPIARDAMRAGVLNLSVALLIARLDGGMQVKATLYAVDPKRFMQGDVLAKIAKAKKHVEDDDSYWRCATETQMREWLKDHTMLPLKPAAWDLADAALLPEAGACTTCPKRSGNAAMLFGDLAGNDDTCTDPACYQRKEKAFVKIQLKADPQAVRLLDSESRLPIKEGATTLKAGQWLIAKAKSCAAVLVGITENGKRLHVCPDQKCKVHKHQVQQPMKRGESAGDWETQQKERAAKQKIYLEAERPIRDAVWLEIRSKLYGPKLIRAALGRMISWQTARRICEMRGLKVKGDVDDAILALIDKASDADLNGWLIDACGAEAVEPNEHMHDEPKRDREDLWALGKLVGVDCDAIADKLLPPKLEPAKKSAPAKAAKKPKKLSAEGRKRIADAMRKRWAKAQQPAKKKAVRK